MYHALGSHEITRTIATLRKRGIIILCDLEAKASGKGKVGPTTWRRIGGAEAPGQISSGIIGGTPQPPQSVCDEGAAFPRVVCAFGGLEAFEDGREGVADSVEGLRCGTAQECFDLGKDLLDRVEVGAVGRKVKQAHSGVFEALADARRVPLPVEAHRLAFCRQTFRLEPLGTSNAPFQSSRRAGATRPCSHPCWAACTSPASRLLYSSTTALSTCNDAPISANPIIWIHPSGAQRKRVRRAT